LPTIAVAVAVTVEDAGRIVAVTINEDKQQGVGTEGHSPKGAGSCPG
jgi:hypothetical protein